MQTAEKAGAIRVAHVLYSFETGGLERGIAQVIRCGSSRFEHIVVCLTSGGETEKFLPAGTEVLALNKRPGVSWLSIWKLTWILRRLRPGVVHTRNWSGVDGILAARLAGIRGVVHGEHGYGTDDRDGAHPRRSRIRRFLSRWVSEYTCVSKAIESGLRLWVEADKSVTQIYNGVDVGRYRPGPEGGAIRSALGIPDWGIVYGIVGRLDPIKDHSTLLAAFRDMRARAPASRLLIVGDGPERERLRELAGEGVTFLGNREDAPTILRALDVFVLCSRSEGISNALLEAMSTGLPVVATRVGGNPELVDDGITGTLVPPGDATGLAAALELYGTDAELRASHGQAGRRRVVQNFSIAAMVNGYEAVWERVAQVARR